MRTRKNRRRKKMKREDLKNQLVNAGVADDKINALLDSIMASNGADINVLKAENEALKSKYAEDIKAKDDSIKEYESRVKGYADYEDLKKFKADTIANAEKSRKVEFLKSQGCKHPDLIVDKLDFSKAKYDEDKKTYTGLDEDIKTFKANYADLFENKGIQQINPNIQPNQVGGDVASAYLKEHPEMAKYMPSYGNQNN